MGNLAQRVALSSFFYRGVPYTPVSRFSRQSQLIGYLPNCTQKNRLADASLVCFCVGLS